MSTSLPTRGPSAIGVVLCAAIAACHGKAPSGSADAVAPPKDAIAKPVEHGPVKVVEKVWPAKPSLGDPIYLRLEIASEPGVSVNAPFQEAGDQRLGRFRIVGFSREGAGTSREVQTYTLEPPASGKQRIPPMRLEIVDSHAAGSDSAETAATASTGSATGSGSAVARTEEPASARQNGATTAAQEILTDEIALDIAPIKAEQMDAKLHGPAGSLDADIGGPPWLAMLFIASALAVFGSGTVLALRARSARRKIAARRSAYDEAIARLAGLEQRGAPEPSLADAWFVDLSSIVRSYLEHRYEIRAPELTTEEFLLVASQASALTHDHRTLLSAFLARCDRVKFAGYRPDSEESIASLAAARAFVEDTRVKQAVTA